MRRIITLIALAAVSLSGMAQSYTFYSNNGNSQVYYSTSNNNNSKKDEITKCIESLPSDRLVGTSGEQGRDKLDSLYFLNMKTYEFPYDSRWDKEGVDRLIAKFVKAYDTDLQSHTGGYCSTNQLRKDNPIESKLLQMYYGEDLEPLVVGGVGRNYIVLRQNDQKNPIYRHIKGVEWWLVETGQKNTPAVRMRAFLLSGPQSESQYQAAMKNSKTIEKAINKRLDSKPSLASSVNDELLKGITVLAKLYTNNKDADMDRAVVRAINDRVVTYLGRSLEFDMEDWFKLFRTLRDIPGYTTSVTFDDPSHSTCVSDFYWLERVYPMLDIFCISHAVPGDPQCVAPTNFNLQVFVNNKNCEELLKLHPAKK